MLRRLRSVLTIALLWAVPWFALGALLGARFVAMGHTPVAIMLVLGVVCAIEGLFGRPRVRPRAAPNRPFEVGWSTNDRGKYCLSQYRGIRPRRSSRTGLRSRVCLRAFRDRVRARLTADRAPGSFTLIFSFR